MSKSQNVKTWSMLLLAGLLSTGTVYAASTNAEPSVAPAAAQQTAGTCTGIVYDETGEPLPGASVRVPGTRIGTSTNIDGEFSLAGVKNGATVTVSFIGYKPLNVIWKGEPLKINMQEDVNDLEEVVVMGYGVEQKRAKVTNSIAKVSEKTLTVGANANPAQALAGAVAGVKVKVTSGDPSATPSIVIRGGTSFDGTGSPVYVIDGQIRSSLSDINPNDIEDMQILKDAGATALYGARAANGVILITTKQGKSGKATVNVNIKYGLNYNRDLGYDFTNAEEFIYWYRRGVNDTEWKNRGGAAQLTSSNSPAGIGRTQLDAGTNFNIMTMTDENKYLLERGWQSMKDPISDATIIFRDIDPLEINLRQPSQTQDYNISFSGGNDRGKYYAGLGYYDAEGAPQNTFYKRYNFAFTGSYKITDWLESNSVFNYIRSNWQNNALIAGSDNAFFFGRIISVPHTLRLLDEDNNPLLGQSTDNTNLNFQPDKFQRDNQSDKFSMTQSLTANLFKGFSLKGTMSWYYNEQLTSVFNKDFQTNQQGTMNTTRSTSMSFLRYFDQTYNLVANYTNTFNESHYVSAMLGTEYYNRDYKAFSAGGQGAPTDYFPNLNLTTTEYGKRTMSSSRYQEKIMSYFGRVEYDYQNKYLIAATFREDGYSRLINHRWGFFPGVSAGWVASSEEFFKKSSVSNWMNYAKIRASVGLNGSVNSNYIGYYTLQGSYSPAMYNGVYGYRISGLPNENLKWEKTRTAEVGVDFGFLQNRFNLGLTYYNRLTSDKYANLSLPQTTGFSSVVSNNGKVRNQGLEIDFNGTLLRTRNFTWTLGANLTYNRTCVVELPNNGLPNNRQGGAEVWVGDGSDKTMFIGGTQEGQEPMHLIGYKKAHIIRSEADMPKGYIDIANSSGSGLYTDDEGLQKLKALGYTTNYKLQPGDVIWQDRNGDNIIDSRDQYDLGNRLPHWTGGFNTNLTWKGLSLYARFDMGFDITVYDGPFAWWMGCGQGSYSMPTAVKDTWTPENPNAKYPRYVWASNFGSDAWIRTSDVIAQNGAYLACRELSLSYQLPANICSKFYCQGLSLSVTGQNLGYLKKCTNPLPDNTTYTNGATSGWGGTYNLPKTLLFGLNVTF